MKTILLFWLAFAWSLTTYAQSSDNRIVEGGYFPNAYVQKNYLKNATCDKNVNDITATGSAALTTSATGKIKGAKSCNINATASTETITWAAFTQEQELYGRNCEAGFTYTGDGSLYKAYVKQGSTQVAQNVTLTSVTTVSKRVVMNFPCGDISTAPTVVIEATGDGAAIIVDDVYYGLATNLSTASVDTEWTAYTPTLSWLSGTLTSTTAFWRRVGDTMEVKIGLVANGAVTAATLTATIPTGYTIDTSKITSTSGTAPIGHLLFYDDSGGSLQSRVMGVVRYANTTTVSTFVMDDAAAAVHYLDVLSNSIPVTVAINDQVQMYFSVPISGWTASTVVKQEIAGWFVDANISGANPSLGVAAVTSYTEIIDAGLTMTPRTNSQPVGIMCSTTNAATAPTTSTSVCAAGSESIGANFVIPSAGTYEVCFYGSNTSTADTGEGIFATFELIETPTSAQTLTLEGGTRIQAGQTAETIASGADQVVSGNITNCSLFNWSAGTKGVRLMYEQSVTGTPDAHAILGDAGANNGQRDMRITVRPWITAQNSPLFVGSVLARDNTSDVTTINTIVSKAANYTATTQDETIVFTADATLTLPAAANVKGKKYHVMASGSGTDVTIDGNASETTCGRTTIVLNGDKDAIDIQSDGSNWIGLNGGCEIMDRVTGTCSSSASISTQSRSGVSIGNIASGCCALTFPTGKYAATPSLVTNFNNTSSSGTVVIGSGSSATAGTVCSSLGGTTSYGFNLIIGGAR